jgi:hypothetical protein
MAGKDDTITFNAKTKENQVRNTAKITIRLEAWKTTMNRHQKINIQINKTFPYNKPELDK